MNKTNAERFITAYNNIDYGLRSIYNFKRSMTYSDVVRRCVVLNSVVRKYEEDLIDFGRLRNAIIHHGNSKYTIAEPHDDIVEKIEKLAELISAPPVALGRVGNKEVVTIDFNTSIAQTMEIMHRTGYSNLPIYNQEKLVGVLNRGKLMDVLGKKISEEIDLQDYVSNTPVGEIVADMGEDSYYILADERLTIEAAMNYFESNRKLLIILITKDAKENGRPLSIISYTDIIDMKKILDIY